MPDKNSSKEDRQTSEGGGSIQFKLMLAVIALGVLSLILKVIGVF